MAHSLGNLSACTGVDQGGMLRVLGRGPNTAHSEGQFRPQYAREFPACAMPALNAGCIGSGSAPTRSATTSALVEGWQFRILHWHRDVAEADRGLRALRDRQGTAKGVTAILLRASTEEGELAVQRLRERLQAYPARSRSSPSRSGRWLATGSRRT